MSDHTIIVSGGFDDLRAEQILFLHQAAQLGPLWVVLWSDEAIQSLTRHPPKFPLSERKYLLESIRFVNRVIISPGPNEPHELPVYDYTSQTVWVLPVAEASPEKEAYCRRRALGYRVLDAAEWCGFPEVMQDPATASRDRKKVIVTGCYDWLHSGHVRFFEEVSELGDLYVVVGHDANIRLLKGEGHPMFPQEHRRYMCQAIRFVTQALISSGEGWLDAEPEIKRIRPDMYAVNEDGDRPEKRNYCNAHGIEYRVLKRLPKEGLPSRQSTVLRGF